MESGFLQESSPRIISNFKSNLSFAFGIRSFKLAALSVSFQRSGLECFSNFLSKTSVVFGKLISRQNTLANKIHSDALSIIIQTDELRIHDVKPAAHLRRQLSKLPREAISSAVSSCVRLSFREFFASRGREENVYHV